MSNNVRLLFELPLDVVEHIALRQHQKLMRSQGTRWNQPRPAVVKKIARDFVRHILTNYDECRFAEPGRIEEFKKQTGAIVLAKYPTLATQAEKEQE